MDNSMNTQSEFSKDRKGISNSTVAVLIILALVITIIGTWAVLNSVSESQSKADSGTNMAQVSLNIVAPEKLAKQSEGTTLKS